MKKLLSRKYGFTLIELMIVMAIIAILAVLGIAAIQTARRAARDTQRRDNAKTIMAALEAFYAVYKRYPDPCPAQAPPKNCGWLGGGITWNELDPFLDDNLSDPLSGNLKTSSCDPAIEPDGDPCYRYWYRLEGDEFRYKWFIVMESKYSKTPLNLSILADSRYTEIFSASQ